MKKEKLFKINYKNLSRDIKKFGVAIIVFVMYFAFSNIVMGTICPSRILFGIPCPGCGMTRAFYLLLQGKVAEATHMHIFWIPVLLLTIWAIVARYFVIDEHKSYKMFINIKKCVIMIMLLSLIYYTYRMVMWFPHEEPVNYYPRNLVNMIKQLIK